MEFNMIWIADIVAAIILLVSVIKGAKKGFIKGIFGLLITVASIAVAFLCADTVAGLTKGLFGLEAGIVEGLKVTFGDLGLNVDLSNQEAVKEALIANNDFFAAATFLADIVAKEISAIPDIPAGELSVVLSEIIGGFATNIVVGIVLFILCRIVLSIVEKVLTSLVEHIKLLDAVNTLLGAVVGLLKGIIIVTLICMLLSSVPFFGDLMAKMPETLFVYNWFVVGNPIVMLIGKFATK